MGNGLIRWLSGVLLLGCVFIVMPAVALPPIPPTYMWFRFQTEQAQPVTPEGVQLTACRTSDCEQPVLLMRSGTCDQTGCVPGAPVLNSPHRFECAENTCLYSESPFSAKPTGSSFKLIAQIQNRVLVSPPFSSEFRSAIAGNGERDRTVIVAANQLQASRNPSLTQATRWETFSRGFAITLISELVAAAIALRWLPRTVLTATLAMVSFANLLTFPVVWFFFPALQPFQYSASRAFGGLSFAIAIVFSVFLATRKTITPRILVKTFVIWVVSLPFWLGIGYIAALMVGYGQFLPPAAGIPSLYTLTASEIFAVIWEAWLIQRMSQPVLNTWQAGLLSGLTNAVSLLLVLVLLPPIR